VIDHLDTFASRRYGQMLNSFTLIFIDRNHLNTIVVYLYRGSA
jgi:hypothetical protein